MTVDPRRCVICDAEYRAGTYGKHRLTHTVQQYAQPHHSKRSRGPVDAARAAEIVRVATEGRPFREIGAQFGISGERVRQVLRASGLTGADLHALVLSRTVKRTHKLCPDCGETYEIGQGLAHREAVSHRWLRLGSRSDPSVRGAIAADYAAGMKVERIAAKYGITHNTIHYARRQFHLPLRRPNMGRKTRTNAESRAQISAITADLASGLSKSTIAARYGVSPSWVRIVEKRAAVPA